MKAHDWKLERTVRKPDGLVSHYEYVCHQCSWEAHVRYGEFLQDHKVTEYFGIPADCDEALVQKVMDA